MREINLYVQKLLTDMQSLDTVDFYDIYDSR